jgi:hypothetical protein
MADQPFARLFRSAATNFPAYNRSHASVNAELGATGDDLSTLLRSYRDSIPTMVAFVDDSRAGMVYFAHSLTQFLPAHGNANAALNHRTVGFMGSDPDTVVPMVFHPDAFNTVTQRVMTRTGDHIAHRATHLAVGGALTVMPLVPEQLVAGDPNATSEVTVSRVCLVPHTLVGVVAARRLPAVTLENFQALILDRVRAGPGYNAADYTHLENWWKVATSLAADGSYPIACPSIQVRTVDLAFRYWARRAMMGVLAPLPDVHTAGLTAVTAAVREVSHRLEDTETARRAEAAARQNVTFEERFGAATFNAVCRFVRQATHADLPEIHRVMASYDKRSRDQVTLNLALQNAAADVPAINETNLPKCTPYLLEILRNHSLIGNSMELGEGLNPFSVICHGHPNTKDILMLADQQSMVEAGSSVGLSEALQFKTKDGRFPRTYLQASDKLWAFLLVIRVYFGDGHALTTALNASLTTVAPMLLQLESLFSSSPRQGMLVAIRVMAFYQRKVGLYLRRARDTPVTDAVPAPDFESCADDLRMQSYDSLPRIPDFWMDIIKSQIPELYPQPAERIRGGGPTDSSSGSNQFVLANPDRKLIKRFKNSGLNTVGALKDGWDESTHGPYVFPSVGGQEICLKCQYAGKCKKGCKNSASHVAYSGDVNKMLHGHLDKCGVAKLE